MDQLSFTYRTSLGLLTDLYQLTMTQAAWKQKRHELQAVFHLTMRRGPFGGDFGIAAGIEAAMEYASNLAFDSEDLDYLSRLPSLAGGALFDEDFLSYLANFRPNYDIAAVREGETLLAGSPMIRVEGEYLGCQLLETPFLTLVGMPTQVATRAARICHWAARGAGENPPQSVLEFGLRRAHGVDGGLSVSRAAYLGGCAATSNLLAGRLFGIPVSGTHAHSWVLSFEDEIEAFRSYAEVFPDDTTLLVDTFNTTRGVERAAEVGLELKSDGHDLVGVRLDSGDLATLSQAAREILDQSGLPSAKVAASGDLDEYRIEQLRRRGANIDVWGIGSRLATCHGDSSFSGAYKLASIEDAQTGEMRPVAKISEDTFKRSLPGRLQVYRTLDASGKISRGDELVDLTLTPNPEFESADDSFEGENGDGKGGESGRAKTTEEEAQALLVPTIVDGKRTRPAESLEKSRARAARCATLLGWGELEGSSDQAEASAGLPDENGPPAHGLALQVDEAVERHFRELLARAQRSGSAL